MEDEKYPYQKEWESLRARNKLFWCFALSLVPLYFLLEFTIKKYSENIQNTMVYIILVDWAIILITAISFYVWKCPRCKKHYFSLLVR